jgi:hypothetical protein
MTRVYCAGTVPGLALVQQNGEISPPTDAGVPVHAVTPALREWYTEGDLEELEFVALLSASRESLSLLAADPSAPPRRVVLAADVDAGTLTPDPSRGRSGARVSTRIPLSAVVSVHIDETGVAGTIAAAVRVEPAAASGDEDAVFQVDHAQACDLLWYDVTEIPDLVQ